MKQLALGLMILVSACEGAPVRFWPEHATSKFESKDIEIITMDQDGIILEVHKENCRDDDVQDPGYVVCALINYYEG